MTNQNKYYVYAHINIEKNEIFYIGKGHGKRCDIMKTRSTWHKRIQNKYEIDVLILDDNLTEQQSFELEIEYIRKIGRKDLKQGTLVNLTNGGDGTSGHVFTKEHKRKISESKKGGSSWNKGIERTQATKRKISKIHKGKFIGKNNPNFGNKMSIESKMKISTANKGRKHSAAINKSKGRSKIILDTQTGVFYESNDDVINLYGFNRNTFCHWLNGNRKNKTQFVYA